MLWGVLVYTMLTTTSAFDRINQFTVYLLLDSDLDASPLLGYPKNVLGPAFKHWPVNCKGHKEKVQLLKSESDVPTHLNL